MYHLTFPPTSIQKCEIAVLPTLAKDRVYMPMSLEQLRNQLSAIEPNDSTYAGIGASEISLLEQLLQDKEAWMASRAVFALSRVPDEKATTILARIVADPRQEV